MRTLVVFFLAGFVLIACSKESENSTDLTGTYKGTFRRSGPAYDGAAVNVTINFHRGTFTGSGETMYYPAICKGSYEADEASITFTDSCGWTANFDWTLILNGRYDLQVKGDSIFISRSGNGTIPQLDEYRLGKQD